MMAWLPGLGIGPKHWSFLKAPKAYQKMYNQACPGEYPLLPEPTQRQFKTAVQILRRLRSQKGLLLADDVGLGKTTVAALIAGVFAGRGKRVRVLAPNPAMARRWRKEIDRQLAVLVKAAPKLNRADLERARRRLEGVANLQGGEIQVTTHGRAAPRSDRRGRAVDCDLLIVDEAHRTRSEASKFGSFLDRNRSRVGRVLLLTATPFSLSISEMNRALRLVEADEPTRQAARRFGHLLDEFWKDSFGDPMEFGKRLGEAGAAAVKALKGWVIRHGVEHLTRERSNYGSWESWEVPVQRASERSVELLVRAIRTLDLAKKTGAWTQSRTNDPRFHQGWRHLAKEISQLPSGSEDGPRGTHVPALEYHRRWVNRALAAHPSHEKIEAAVEALRQVVRDGEKSLVFCDYHATAQDLTRAVCAELRHRVIETRLPEADWRKAWRACLEDEGQLRREADGETTGKIAREQERFGKFIKWLACGAIRQQVSSWLPREPRSVDDLVGLLRRASARGNKKAGTIQKAAARLYRELNDPESSSTRAVLQSGAKYLPGWGNVREVAMSTAREPARPPHHVFFEAEPDSVMAIFNSPFGPDVLIATDRLSEGVDLHRSCRHIMQYELDPSPIRTVQRRGRIRRIGSWASVTGKPIMEAYPALEGTRDRALVQIMRQRLGQFDLLLGGVSEIDMDATGEQVYSWQCEALAVARRRLQRLSLALI